jgi:hypothetical protein
MCVFIAARLDNHMVIQVAASVKVGNLRSAFTAELLTRCERSVSRVNAAVARHLTVERRVRALLVRRSAASSHSCRVTNMALEGLYGWFPIDVPDAMYRAL